MLCSIAIQNDITTEGCVFPIVVLSLLFQAKGPYHIVHMTIGKTHDWSGTPLNEPRFQFQSFFFGK